MKGFVGMADNDWFAFLFTAATLPETPRQSTTKTVDKNNGGQVLQKDGG